MQALVSGLVGAIGIVPIALAFAVVYVPTRVFHIALAGVYAFAPYAAWALMRGGFPLPLAFGVLANGHNFEDASLQAERCTGHIKRAFARSHLLAVLRRADTIVKRQCCSQCLLSTPNLPDHAIRIVTERTDG